MKNLIYIANVRLPTEKAHGFQIVKTCEALASVGVHVKLLIPRRFNKIKDDVFEFYNLKKNFVIGKLPCLDFVAIKFLGRLGFWLESLSFVFFLCPYLKIKKIVSPVYYTRDFLPAFVLSLFFDQVVYEMHDFPERGLVWYQMVWKRCKKIIVISDALSNELRLLDISPQKIVVARDAVDFVQWSVVADQTECRRRLNLQLNQKIVLYTGHLYAWKGANLLAEASRQLPADIHIYLVGGTVDDVAVYKQKYQANNLTVVGWKPIAEIPIWLKAADFLVLPNSAKYKIGSVYTSPLKLFEYLASGTPVVAADVPAVREVVSEAEVTFFQADNSKDLSKILIDSFSHISGRQVMATKATEKAKTYDWHSRALLISNTIFR